mgnify:CR=1 FL=1
MTDEEFRKMLNAECGECGGTGILRHRLKREVHDLINDRRYTAYHQPGQKCPGCLGHGRVVRIQSSAGGTDGKPD